ncbi:unnamed protein product [Miscanthus lutarioriparius]|uniref:Cytochrome P450 n=1 Tax=Miscanthus lutarioriparius TaxID=422564 RepID=A0A811R7K7_9POAL|nr:unnamed protein product [Miscanthus lutarioriparius]
MQDALIFLLLLPLTLFILIFSRHRHALAREAAYTRLAAVKSAVLRKLPTLGRHPEVFVTDRFTAHRLLVSGAAAGGAFSDRPPSIVPSAVLSRRRHYNINSAPYGPLWRAIRRNLTSEIFHPSRLRQYSPARRHALRGLIEDLDRQCASGGVVLAAGSLRAAMFGLLATLCFGAGVNAGLVRPMADAQDDLVQCFLGLRVFATLPAVTGLIYRDRWRKLLQLRQQQEETYLPLIDAHRRDGRPNNRHGEPPAYVDLRVPDEHAAAASGSDKRRKRQRQRRLTDGELVGLCSEFLGAGTEPAAAALQWIMANLVKRPDVQRALRKEIDAAVGADAEEVGEEVLGRLEYLNAVIMEGLRLHPTVPMVLRKVMAEDHVVLDGRRLPAGTAVHFPLARLARDKTAWTDPREFRPERFLAGGEGAGVSLVAAAGSAGEIRMMPFGAGRRMCPGMGVAVLHLGYFVANLVREFEWAEAEGELAVDLRPRAHASGSSQS